MTALVGVFAALAMTVGLAPAEAAPASDAGTKALPKHQITRLQARTTDSRAGKHVVLATIPTAKGKMVNVQKSRSKSSGYRTIASKRTNADNGRVTIRFRARAGYHIRLRIPKTSTHRTTFPYVGKVTAQRAATRLTH